MSARLEVVLEREGPTGGTQRLVRDTAEPDTFYVLSDVGFETLAFPCDSEGEVTDWSEVAGRMHGGQSLDEVQVELERKLATGTTDETRDENLENVGLDQIIKDILTL